MKTCYGWMTLAVLLSAALMSASAARADESPGLDPIQRRVERMKADLDLTADQATRIESILRDAEAQRKAQGQDGRSRTPRAREQRQQVRAQIDAVLTEEQRAKRDELIRARAGTAAASRRRSP